MTKSGKRLWHGRRLKALPSDGQRGEWAHLKNTNFTGCRLLSKNNLRRMSLNARLQNFVMWTERLSTATLSSFCLYKTVTAIPLCKRNGNLTPPTGCYIRMLIHSCYELFPKSILPFLKKLTTFWKRGRIIWKCSCLNSPLKQCLNAVLIAFKRCFKRDNWAWTLS